VSRFLALTPNFNNYNYNYNYNLKFLTYLLGNVSRGHSGAMAIAATLQTPPKSRARTLTTTTIITTTIVKKRSIKAQERDILLSKAILGEQNGKYKTTQAVATALGLRLDTI
jgi:hypothetical protein